MQKNTLICLLDGMKAKERKEFRKFLASPFFNQRKDVCLVYDYYLDKQSFIFPRLDKPTLFKKVYPGQRFDDAKVRHLLSYLTRLVKQYFAQVAYRKDPIANKINLLEEFYQRDLLADFEREWKKTDQLMENQMQRSSDFYFERFVLQRLRTDLLFKQKRQGDLDQQKVINDLLISFVAAVLKQSCSVLLYQRMSSKTGEIELLDVVLKMVKDFDLINAPIVAAYYYSVLSLIEPDKKQHHETLTQLIQTFWQTFPLQELRAIHLIAINYGIKKLNDGKTEYIREAFELYRSGLEKEVLFDNGVLSLFTYKNILKLGLKLKEFDWVDAYLDKYKAYLHPSQRENYYTYCRAVFYFNKPDYDKVLELLQQISFKDKLHELDARRMLMVIYYEQNEYSALESLLDSFSAYIHRHKELGYHKESYSNLIRFVKKMIKEDVYQKAIREKLKIEVRQTSALAERDWLLNLLND